MPKGPKLRLSFLNSIQICRPNDPSTLVKTPLRPLTYFPSHSHTSKTYDISLPNFPDPPSTPVPHHKRNLHSSITTQHHQSKPCIMNDTKSSRDDKEKLYHSSSSSSDLNEGAHRTEKKEKNSMKKPKAKVNNLPSTPSFKNSCSSPIEEEPLNRREKSVKQTSVRTRRFKRYGSKDWRDGSTAKLENEPSEKVVDRHEKQSFVVVKRSVDPYQDFKKSILEMILERKIFEPKDLEQLLMSFLSLNSRMHHKAILKAFSEIWKEVFSGPSN